MLPVILHQYIIARRISKGNQNFSKNSAVRALISGKINRLVPVQPYSVPHMPPLFWREAKIFFSLSRCKARWTQKF